MSYERLMQEHARIASRVEVLHRLVSAIERDVQAS
jgi:hypothetical protein